MDAAIVFAVAALTTGLATPVARRLAWRIGAVVAPDARRVHAEPLPQLGGLGMLVGLLVAFAVATQLEMFESVFDVPTVPLGIVVAAVIIYIVGAIDDVQEISAPAKTAGMVLAGTVLNFAGISVLLFRLPPVGLIGLSPDWAAFATVLAVVGMCNAINFIDGLDGLAAGIVGIASGAIFLFANRLAEPDMALLSDDNITPLLAIATAGVCLGFLFHNWHPSSIIMGDGGALLLGLVMAAEAISVGGNSTADSSGQTFFFFAPLFIPLVVLGVPIADTIWAIVRRASSRSGFSVADKKHLHHRLMALGHGQRRSVLILWIWTALLSALVLYPTYTESDDGFLPIGIGALALLLYTLLHPVAREQRRANQEPEEIDGPPVPDPHAVN